MTLEALRLTVRSSDASIVRVAADGSLIAIGLASWWCMERDRTSIVDSRMPPTWRVSVQQNGAVVFIAPADASDLYFPDRVDRGDATTLASLREILNSTRANSDQKT